MGRRIPVVVLGEVSLLEVTAATVSGLGDCNAGD